MKKYICGVDFQYELGYCSVRAYDSLEELKEKTKCWDDCGIVEVEIADDGKLDSRADVLSHKWLVEENLFKKGDDK